MYTRAEILDAGLFVNDALPLQCFPCYRVRCGGIGAIRTPRTCDSRCFFSGLRLSFLPPPLRRMPKPSPPASVASKATSTTSYASSASGTLVPPSTSSGAGGRSASSSRSSKPPRSSKTPRRGSKKAQASSPVMHPWLGIRAQCVPRRPLLEAPPRPADQQCLLGILGCHSPGFPTPSSLQ